MLTLAISQLFFVLAEKWRGLTHGGDGFTFGVPEIFRDRFTFIMYHLYVYASFLFYYVFLQSLLLGKY